MLEVLIVSSVALVTVVAFLTVIIVLLFRDKQHQTEKLQEAWSQAISAQSQAWQNMVVERQGHTRETEHYCQWIQYLLKAHSERGHDCRENMQQFFSRLAIDLVKTIGDAAAEAHGTQKGDQLLTVTGEIPDPNAQTRHTP